MKGKEVARYEKGENPMIIDIHYHVWDEGWRPERFWDAVTKLMIPGLARTGKEMSEGEFKRKVLPSYWDPKGEKLIKAMEEEGIDKTVISVSDLGTAGMGEAKVPIREINKSYAEIANKYPDKVIAFFGIDPRREKSLRLFEVAVKEWGMKGLKFHPDTGFYPNEKVCYPFYQKALELRVPVLIHTGPMVPGFRNKYSQPIYLDDLLVDFPGLKIIAAHCGDCWSPEWAGIAFGNNLYGDLALWQLKAKYNYKAFCQTLRTLMDTAGSHKILYGTDGFAYSPLISNKEWIDIIQNLPKKAPEGLIFNEEEIVSILGGNAKKLLGIEP